MWLVANSRSTIGGFRDGLSGTDWGGDCVQSMIDK